MATTTTNLKLAKPAETDNVSISVLDTNFDLIDAAYKSNKDEIDSLKNAQKVYVAKYSTGTYSDIQTYYNKGYVVICNGKDNSGNVFNAPLTGIDSNGAYFGQYNPNTQNILGFKCSASDSSWSVIKKFKVQDVANKVTTISSSSTDTQYPSAKCVYDTVAKAPVQYTADVGTTWTLIQNQGYKQQITVNGILATDNPIIDVDLSSITTPAQVACKTAIDNFSLVGRAECSKNKITLWCYDTEPTSAFKIKVMVIR